MIFEDSFDQGKSDWTKNSRGIDFVEAREIMEKSELYRSGEQEMKKKSITGIHKKITAQEFDEKFEKGEDLSELLDWENSTKRIPFDLPLWAVKKIDQEAARRGMTRQSLIKNWVIDKVDELMKKHAV